MSLFAFVGIPQVLAKPVNKPNIIIYVTDDQGLETLGIYGGKDVPTPHLDSFAKQGVYFTHAFASASSCAVSRANILSGQHGHVNGMYGHAHGKHHFSSFDNTLSLPNRLTQEGYRTARVGKYHLAPAEVYQFDQVLSGKTKSGFASGRSLVEMADEVMSFVKAEGEAGKQQPFFLYIAPNDPHRAAPHQFDKANSFGNRKGGYPGVKPFRQKPSEVGIPNYLPDLPQIRDEMVEFNESISRIDQGFGRLIQNLKQAGVFENTIILFLSDNGTPMPNAKTTLYDTGIRLPLLMHVPGIQRQGKIDDALVSWVDLTPTLLDLAGVKYKADSFNGRSFKTVLNGKNTDDFSEVYASHNFHEITMYYPMRAVRDKRYKLIWNIAHRLEYPTGWNVWDSSTNYAIRESGVTHLGQRLVQDYKFRAEYELYDLINDPLEVNNLAYRAKHQTTLNKYKNKIKQFVTQTQDPWAIKLIHE
ncbi:sulfatase family protein [Saccharobesus litoralis]|uniref:sulfatase family protein n=1 Tax=Saccharobesus litoralis TaxID=2172099 RepID=UPI00131ED657|nr:sulfatase [Saccharobesus litoralis]